MAGVPVYRGKFGAKEAERLLWRAGFGPKPGEAKRLARKGLRKAVGSLVDPPKARLVGAAPVDGDDLPIDPVNAYGHDQLWFLDKMVRSNQPLVERMALNWHDWFATGSVDRPEFSVDQAKLFRKHGLGSFKALIRRVTVDRAMLIWLSGIYNTKSDPNENYARELMELFTLGASDEGGYPYSEDDVREQARALSGWRADWQDDVGYVNFRFDASNHDNGLKTVFGKTGRWSWDDAYRLCLEHEAHPRYFVERLWSYFIPRPPSAGTRKALVRLYKGRGYAIRPVVQAILMHPDFYKGPALVKPPIVLIAGMLRARRRTVDTDSWTWLSDLSGQRLFDPPNVAGWDEERWLDTSTFRGRWISANQITGEDRQDEDDYSMAARLGEGPGAAVDRALAYWGNPTISSATRAALVSFGRACEDAIVADWQQSAYRALRQNALRLLIATSPDYQAT